MMGVWSVCVLWVCMSGGDDGCGDGGDGERCIVEVVGVCVLCIV